MLLIKTTIGPSIIHGIGLYADQFIPKGTIIWEFTPGFDHRLTKSKLEKWKEIDPDASKYVYLDKNTSQYILCSDNARFMNHSSTPNSRHMYLKNEYGQTIATRDIQIGEEIIYHYQDCERNAIPRGYRDMDNPKVIVKNTRKYGQALFARENINKGEVIAAFNGDIIKARNIFNIPNDPPFELRDHAIQFEENKWRDSKGIAKFIAHSCEPNCGIKEKFKIVALEDIKKGEEVTFDYDMTENSDWQIADCKCGRKNCRKVIHGYRYLSEEVKRKYQGYVSEYLTRL